jgi:hypothetical protein
MLTSSRKIAVFALYLSLSLSCLYSSRSQERLLPTSPVFGCCLEESVGTAWVE